LLGGLAFTWLFAAAARASIHLRRGTWRTPVAPLAAGIIAASVAVALHGLVDSFLSFTATYTLIAITLGLIVAVRTLHERSGVIPSGNERNGEEHAHRV
jgi:uncharacterized membrane protein YoaK (UPF0700 family)